MTNLDVEAIAKVEEILGAHRVGPPRTDGKWVVWELRVSDRTAEKFFRRLKRSYPASFLRRERIGVHVQHLTK